MVLLTIWCPVFAGPEPAVPLFLEESYPVYESNGHRGNALAVGDFDDDGHLDLVVATIRGGYLLFGAGDGSFPVRTSPTGLGFPANLEIHRNLTAVAVDDLDGDGNLDIVFTESLSRYRSGRIAVHLGNGQGGFATPRSFPVEAGPDSLSIADFDLDGILDVVVAHDHGISLFSGLGRGELAAGRQLDSTENPAELTASDLDGDGAPDLLVLETGADRLHVAWGDGDGTFTPFTAHVVGDAPVALTVADLDGDGRDDVAVANRASSDLSTLTNGGGRRLESEVRSPGAGIYTAITASDLDDDGTPELLAASAGIEGVEVFRPLGNGAYERGSILPAGRSPREIIAADLDGDGLVDIAVTAGSAVSVLLRTPDGGFVANRRVGEGRRAGVVWREPVAVAVGDVDGDGHPDLAVANRRSNDVSILVGEGSGRFEEGAILAAGKEPASVILKDLDGDGNLDLAVANAGSDDLTVRIGNGDGTFSGESRLGVIRRPEFLEAQDLDGDGAIDLVAGSGRLAGLSLLWGRGDGTFATEERISLRWRSEVKSLDVADLDDDGTLDVVAGLYRFTCSHPWVCSDGVDNVEGRVAVLLGNGERDFDAPVLHDPGQAFFGMRVGDFDGDGIEDVVQSSGLLLRGTGNGDFHPEPLRSFSLGGYTSSMEAGDLDGDGIDDLVLGGLRILVGDGAGRFTTQRWFLTGLEPNGLAVGDIDGNGAPDAVVANARSNDVSVFLNRSECSERDAIAPTVQIQPPQDRSVVLGDDFSLRLVFSSDDDDGFWGGVTRERMYLDGCLVRDGAIDGDADGRLSDESIDLDVETLCEAMSMCGVEELAAPVLTIEATDCIGNVGMATWQLDGVFRLVPDGCGGD